MAKNDRKKVRKSKQMMPETKTLIKKEQKKHGNLDTRRINLWKKGRKKGGRKAGRATNILKSCDFLAI